MFPTKFRTVRIVFAMFATMTFASGCGEDLHLEPATLPAGSAGTAYAESICVSNPGRPIAGIQIEEGNPPDGLQLKHVRGEQCATLEGTPVQPGRYHFTVTAGEFGTMMSGKRGNVAYILHITRTPENPHKNSKPTR